MGIPISSIKSIISFGQAAPATNPCRKLPPNRPRILDVTRESNTLCFSPSIKPRFPPASFFFLPISNAARINFCFVGLLEPMRFCTPSYTFLYNVGTANNTVGLIISKSSKMSGTPRQIPILPP